jgi:hypothetical protein
MNTPKEKEIERKIIADALGDDDIKIYLPDAKIIKYSELKKYSDVKELLPKNKSYLILLIESELNKGHWVCLMRYKDKNKKDVIEFFDSLADDGKPDSQLKWVDRKTNKLLGQGEQLLTKLLKKSDIPVIYNKFKFQSEGNKKDGNNIYTCGKHCVYRILNLLQCNRDLEDYFKFMREIKNESKNTYDEIVSHLLLEHLNKNK